MTVASDQNRQAGRVTVPESALGPDVSGSWRAVLYGLRLTADLNPSRLPGREYLIDDNGRATVAGNVSVFFGVCEVVASDIDRIGLGIVFPSHGHDMRSSVLAHGRDPGVGECMNCVDPISAP